MLSVHRWWIPIVIVCLIAASSASCTRRSSSTSNMDCRKDLILVEQQSDAPLHISILETSCQDGDFAQVHFKVEATARGPISGYEIRIGCKSNGVTESYSTVTSRAAAGESLPREQPGSDLVGVRLARGFLKAPVDEVNLSVWSVVFTDGTTWQRVSNAD